MKDIELLPPEQPPIKKRSSQWWSLLIWAVYGTLWLTTLSKVLLRHYHTFALRAIPCLAVIAVLGWLALVPVLRAPEIPVSRFRACVLGTFTIGELGCVAVFFLQ